MLNFTMYSKIVFIIICLYIFNYFSIFYFLLQVRRFPDVSRSTYSFFRLTLLVFPQSALRPLSRGLLSGVLLFPFLYHLGLTSVCLFVFWLYPQILAFLFFLCLFVIAGLGEVAADTFPLTSLESCLYDVVALGA